MVGGHFACKHFRSKAETTLGLEWFGSKLLKSMIWLLMGNIVAGNSMNLWDRILQCPDIDQTRRPVGFY